jgi:hypothetical protein
MESAKLKQWLAWHSAPQNCSDRQLKLEAEFQADRLEMASTRAMTAAISSSLL